MRVLLVSSGSGSRGGGEIFLDYLGRGLRERGHDVLTWIPKHPRMDDLAERCAQFGQVLRSDYRNTYDYPARSLSTCFNWRGTRRIAAEWRALWPDVIHINKQNLEDGLDLLQAARRCRLPSVCTIHLTQTANSLRARFSHLRDGIARWQLCKYDGVFVTVQEKRCAALRDFLAGCVRTTTIFNGVPRIDIAQSQAARAETRAQLGLTDGDFLVLGVGRLVEQKRPFLFLRMAEELHRRLPNARFLWVGDGDLAEQWQDTVARKNLENVISCTGWQPDVLPYLLAADLLLHVAEFEGLPFAVIEAMAAGLPCAVTREFASETALFNDENVLFIEDAQDLHEKLKDSPALARIAGAGRRLIEERLSVGAMVEAYERLYNDVTAERRLMPGTVASQLPAW